MPNLFEISLSMVQSSVSEPILLTELFWFRKIITDPNILSRVNIECQDDMYSKLNVYISELILDGY
jgi:hypothetical protein